MSRAFSEIAFTPTVRAVQTRLGSRELYAPLDHSDERRDALTDREASFIAARDGFYQATVSETGWPYVQYRGGPAGFLKVLDAKTIGYADFRGNVQYISVGNLLGDDRVALILMDYANQRRLKVLGRARLVQRSEDPALLERLELREYRARVERAVVIAVEAFDWNCPKHITPRFTDDEMKQRLATLTPPSMTPNATGARPPLEAPSVLGTGPLELVISGIRQLTPRVRAFELRRPDGSELPPVEAGAHLRIPVLLPNGEPSTRHYSISSDPACRDAYEIAVLCEAGGGGGSRFVHERFSLGLHLRCSEPRNDFRLDPADTSVVLIAGGIGITPIKAMATALRAQGRPFHLHYAARNASDMAYGREVLRELEANVTTYLADLGQRMDLDRILAEARPGAGIHACGPSRLLDGVVASAQRLGIDPERVRWERFTASTSEANQPMTVELRRSGKLIRVAADQTVLAAVRAAGVEALSECEVGNCGTCAVKVLEGVPEHRDAALTPDERARSALMCICVSRSSSERLALDL